MHPGASSCAPTSDEPLIVVPGARGSLARRHGCVVLLLAAGLALAGCATSSPRFTSRPAPLPVPVASAPDTALQAAEPADPPPDTPVVALSANAPVSRGEDNAGIDRHAVLSRIMAMMGTPYASRGEDSTGFDCSGFTSTIYGQCLGVELPRSTAGQFAAGVPVKRNRLKFGDLVFFRTTGRSVSHVGIYVGDGLFAHSSVSLGVTISLLASSYYNHRYLGARRIVE